MMGWSRSDEEFRADHDRDERKHERPGHRFDKPLTTAMDIVVLVKALPNYQDAAALVEQYAAMVAATARAEETAIALKRLQPQESAHA